MIADQPTFPCSGTEGVNPESLGMSLRQYYAGLAMQGLVSCELPAKPSTVARDAVEYADFLIAELEKEGA